MIQMLVDATIDCGGINVPVQIAHIIGLAIQVIKIAVPILLIIWGMLDLGKAVMAQKEDEIKKGQQTFLKRLMAAAIVFFVVVIAEFLVGLLAKDDTEKSTITGCIDKIVDCANKSACK